MKNCLRQCPISVANWIGGLPPAVTVGLKHTVNLGGSLVALVQGARKYKLTRPKITEQNIIRIKGGRSVSRTAGCILAY